MNIVRKVHTFISSLSTPGERSSPKAYFSHVYKINLWGGSRSASGPGSEGRFADQKTEVITAIVRDRDIKSVLDIGCGDCNWIFSRESGIQRYHGVDVVPGVIRDNKKRYGNGSRTFQRLDLTGNRDQKKLALRKADLVLCLDVFGHLLNREIDSLLSFVLASIRPRYFLVTNRWDLDSGSYLLREKTRLEGICIEKHPVFEKSGFERIDHVPALYAGDFFDLYRNAAMRP